jgi:hypothetical protein
LEIFSRSFEFYICRDEMKIRKQEIAERQK